MSNCEGHSQMTVEDEQNSLGEQASLFDKMVMTIDLDSTYLAENSTAVMTDE